MFAVFDSLAYDFGVFGGEDRDNRGDCDADEHSKEEC